MSEQTPAISAVKNLKRDERHRLLFSIPGFHVAIASVFTSGKVKRIAHNVWLDFGRLVGLCRLSRIWPVAWLLIGWLLAGWLLIGWLLVGWRLGARNR
jgi:hypothetical protein